MDCEVMSAQVKFVTAEINAQAERHGEKYVLDKPEKLVGVCRYRTYLHTFTVKQVVPNPGVVKTIVQAMVFHAGHMIFQLRDWRFKPRADSTLAKELLPQQASHPRFIYSVSSCPSSELDHDH